MRAANVARLGLKELRSLAADPVLVLLILYTFTYAIYAVATGANFEVSNAAVAVVDDDRSALSFRLRDAVLPPQFAHVVEMTAAQADAALDAGDTVFVLHVPAGFEADLLRGRPASLLLDVDATAMTQAGNGAAYLQSIIARELAVAAGRDDGISAGGQAVDMVVRARFNPNLSSVWFNAVMQVINNVTMLSVILAGAALIREREHGTIEHLLVMPVTPAEIMAAKIGANGLVIVVASLLSLLVMVQGVLGVPVRGSLLLYAGGAVLYQLSVTALGILLATIARSMPQFGLLVIPVIVTMNLLSGSSTPLESMPDWLQWLMQASPATHFVAFSQAVLYRGAGLAIVWPMLAALALIGAVIFAVALARFRRTVVEMG
ncbi:ABC transporter permease [Tistrella bauzanensis]|uniref:ABC transporter permease n=1 Tax=Tistrella arctica TaxID=3133430 RepID=A0ABU9YH04_9PROT